MKRPEIDTVKDALMRLKDSSLLTDPESHLADWIDVAKFIFDNDEYISILLKTRSAARPNWLARGLIALGVIVILPWPGGGYSDNWADPIGKVLAGAALLAAGLYVRQSLPRS